MIRVFVFIMLFANVSLAAKSTIWSFVGRDGSDKWASIDERFRNCKGVTKEITVITNKDLNKNGKPIIFDYKAYAYPPASIEKSKHINIGKKIYKLVEFHIRLPSEHSINGKVSKAVVHFVHQDANNNIVVVAVMIKEGKSNSVIENLIATVSDKPEIRFAVEDGDLTALLPKDKQYYYDQATITTCPCAGKVSWYVMKDPIEASSEEIIGLKKTIATK